jgi:shikimate kinase
MKNIYLVGFMGTGKTSVGKILAEKLKKEFVEMDAIIEQKEGNDIPEIFAQKGERHFRNLERKLLEELAARRDLVVSCGGGLVCDQENLDTLKASGTVFSLSASIPVIYERISQSTHRPLLNVENPLQKIESLLRQRLPYYQKAGHLIDTDEYTPSEIADKIIAIINNV